MCYPNNRAQNAKNCYNYRFSRYRWTSRLYNEVRAQANTDRAIIWCSGFQCYLLTARNTNFHRCREVSNYYDHRIKSEKKQPQSREYCAYGNMFSKNILPVQRFLCQTCTSMLRFCWFIGKNRTGSKWIGKTLLTAILIEKVLKKIISQWNQQGSIFKWLTIFFKIILALS